MGAYDKQPGDKLLQSAPHCKGLYQFPTVGRKWPSLAVQAFVRRQRKTQYEAHCRPYDEYSGRIEIVLLALAVPEAEDEELASLLPLAPVAARRAHNAAKREQRMMQEFLFNSFLQMETSRVVEEKISLTKAHSPAKCVYIHDTWA